MFSRQSIREITTAARDIDVEAAALLAVADIESGGRAYALIDGRKEPLIRFEGHYFDRRLSGENRTFARKAGLASPTAGAVANPSGQAARWELVTRAAAIDRKAAYESVSWGLGQVMGANWAWLGYADVDALVAEARQGVCGQARLMARFVARAGLASALRDHDWAAFARGYNGPAYATSGYDRKLAKAYAAYAASPGKPADALAAPDIRILRAGDRGDDVTRLQRTLTTLGYPLADDGIFGPATSRAVKNLQLDRGLPGDGIAGPQTVTAMRACLPAKAQSAGLCIRFMALLRMLFGVRG